MNVMPCPYALEKVFNLTLRAITDWSLGKPVKLYTLKIEPFYLFAGMAQALPQQPVHLRIALFPPGKVSGPDSLLCNRIQVARVYFIDNVRCDIIRDTKDDIKTVEFSFILPEEQKLPRGYTGALTEVHGQPIVRFGSLDVFKVEKLKTPFPFRGSKVAKTSRPKFISVECTETVDSYTLHMNGKQNFRPLLSQFYSFILYSAVESNVKLAADKLKVTSNSRAPCR